MRRVEAEEFKNRTDQGSFKPVVIEGEKFKEYANKSFILRALKCVISASPLAGEEPLNSANTLGQLGLSGLQIMQTRHHIIIGMLVSYARCFTNGIYTIKSEDYLKSGQELDNHDFIMDLRSKYAAHDVSHLRHTSVDLRVSCESEEYALGSRGSDVNFDGILAKLISQSSALVMNQLEKEINQLEKQLEEELNKMKIDDLRQLPDYQQPPVDIKNVGKRRPS